MLNESYGGKLATPITGIILMEMNDFLEPVATNHFGVIPSHANFIIQGKNQFNCCV